MWTEKIRTILDSGLTQTDVAEYIGVKQPAISKILSEPDRQPLYMTCIKIDELYRKVKRKHARARK